MKKLTTSLLVVFTVLLATQFAHLAYRSVFHNSHSVLDVHEKKKTPAEFDSSLSLKELSMIHADAEKRIRLYESGKSQKQLAEYRKSGDPYQMKSRIEETIRNREADSRALTMIAFFCISGILFIVTGSLLYIKYQPWVGAPFVISGFIEMIWNTGPLFFMNPAPAESLLVINVRLVSALVTLGAVIAFWHFFRSYFDR